MRISNAADSYFLTYVAGANPLNTSIFMWLGTIPAFIFIPLVPAMKRRMGKKGLFNVFIGRYELSDGRMAEINGIVESRHRADTI